MTWPELMQSIKEVHADPRFSAVAYFINDFSACDSLTFDPQEVEQVAAASANAEKLRQTPYRVAFVAQKPELRARITFYIGCNIAASEMKLFSELQLAQQWILTG